MRLTSVTHLRLPYGTLLGYDVTVGRRGDPVPVSFDQRRHVDRGDRPGSWMAITCRLPAVDLDALAEAWLAVLRRHGTLRTVFSPGPAGPRLHEVDLRPGRWVTHPIAPGQAVDDAVRRMLDERCTPYAAPSHRLCVILTADRPTLVVAADHAHVDMWSLLVILRDLVQGLGGTLPAGTVRPFAEHTAALAEREPAPDEVRQRWAEILAAGGDVMPRFPLPLGELTPAPPERVEVRDVLGVDDCALFERRARASGVSTLALVTSVMTRTTRELAHAPLRAVFPVHSRYDDRWHGSVGWFITNAVIDAGDPDPRACADAVREAVRLGSWPLDDVLAPWGGMPEAPGMFAISWLDLRRLPVRIDHAGLEAQYVSSAGDADGVMLWFILDEAGLHLRCRYPDTDEARENVGAWLDRVVDGVRASAHPAGADVVLAGGRLVVDRATRADVPAVVALLSGAGDTADPDDPDDPDLAPYEEAFDALDRDPGRFLAVARAGDGRVVATVQLTILPGPVLRGTTRLQVEGLRVAVGWRRRGVGSALLEWAHEHGRARGAVLARAGDTAGDGPHPFLARFGYQPDRAGYTRPL
ncbi:GNAT family N-acetyltransferase [Pseudonocardia sp. HH130629-09]|uniref:GNAT family N-acetyltransferase n=1 Tax=Pseudonocardia sp. HH130629-09 TaxID=1641402 RepID=UPI0006CAFBBE|nr:GNAT family N-acetyltransferase [Pseudonocardia sp. HH130629-09]ALE84261.1 peptide synthetase [Pseudonocardia sp. HH130629-09]